MDPMTEAQIDFSLPYLYGDMVHPGPPVMDTVAKLCAEALDAAVQGNDERLHHTLTAISDGGIPDMARAAYGWARDIARVAPRGDWSPEGGNQADDLAASLIDCAVLDDTSASIRMITWADDDVVAEAMGRLVRMAAATCADAVI